MPMSFMVRIGRSRKKRNVARHAASRRQGSAALAGSVNRLRDDPICPLFGWPHDKIIGFSDTNLEFIDVDGLDILSVCLHDRQRKAGNTEIEVGHRRGIDDPKPHALAGGKQACPVSRSIVAIHQIGIGRSGNVGDVGRIHAHFAPIEAIGQRLILSRHQSGERLLLHVEVTGRLLELLQQNMRMKGTPVRKHDDMLPIIANRILAIWIDDDRAEQPDRFLHATMAVIPIGASLSYRKHIVEGAPWLYSGKAYARCRHIGTVRSIRANVWRYLPQAHSQLQSGHPGPSYA